MDTPILDVNIRQSIGEFRTIASRLQNVEVFCQYLDDIWSMIEEGNNLFKWDSISIDLKNDVKGIRERIGIEQQWLKATDLITQRNHQSSVQHHIR